MSKIFTIFMPVGHPITPAELLKGITAYHESTATCGELRIDICEYKDLLEIRDASIPGSLILTSAETFSCGRYYTDETEYNDMVNRAMYGIKSPVVSVSPLHTRPSIQYQDLKNACVMRVQPSQECRIINRNLDVWYSQGTVVSPRVSAAVYSGSKIVSYGPGLATKSAR